MTDREIQRRSRFSAQVRWHRRLAEGFDLLSVCIATSALSRLAIGIVVVATFARTWASRWLSLPHVLANVATPQSSGDKALFATIR